MSFIVTAVVAVEGAIAVTTIASVAAAVGAVGAAMTVVGTLTKSKELVGVGKVLSIAGGVTSLANGAYTALSSSAAAGAASDAAAGAVAGSASDAALDGIVGAAGDAAGTAVSTGAPASGLIGNAMNAGSNVTGIGMNASGMYDVVGGELMNGATSSLPAAATTAGKSAAAMLGESAATQSIDSMVAGLGPQELITPADNAFETIKNKLGDQWNKLSDTTKAELLKSAMAIPGSIQKQKNEEALLGVQRDKVKQSSYGSQVPQFGIIQRAQIPKG